MNTVNEMVIRASMRSMFNKGYISISTIKECLKLAGVTPSGEALNQLSPLHCVDFKDMDRELAEAIPAMVASLFDGMQLSVDDLFRKPEPTPEKVIDVTPAPARRSFLRILGAQS